MKRLHIYLAPNFLIITESLTSFLAFSPPPPPPPYKGSWHDPKVLEKLVYVISTMINKVR